MNFSKCFAIFRLWDGDPLCSYRPSQRIYIFYVAFFYAESRNCLSMSLQDSSSFFDRLTRSVRCSSNIICVICGLVGFHNWVEVLAHKSREGGKRSTKSNCQSSVFKCHASEIKRKCFDKLLVTYLEEWCAWQQWILKNRFYFYCYVFL